MSRRDIGWIAGMGALAAGIWMRDRTWLATAGQTLPILMGFGLFIWLPWPWQWRVGASPCARAPLLASLVLAPAGIALDNTLLLALGWTFLLWSWLSLRVAVPARGTLAKLMTLPLLAFPWLANDFPRLGWSFRLSAAWATSGLLALAHVPVIRQGTLLTIRGFPLSIEPACSGMSGLQAILIGGAALACVRLRGTRMFWPSLLLLPAAAWAANLARVVFAAAMVATLPAAVVDRWLGPLHLAAGWIAVALVFAACGILFGALARWARMRRRDAAQGRLSGRMPRPPRKPEARIVSALARGATQMPWLEMALLAYAGWAARSLWGTWWHAPFERLGGLAFVVWLLPVTIGKLGGAARGGALGEASTGTAFLLGSTDSLGMAGSLRAPAAWRLPAAASSSSGHGASGIGVLRRGTDPRSTFWRVRYPWLAGLGITAVAAGQFGELHLLCQTGLAALIISMAPARAAPAWGAGALAWVSALGWIGARWSVPPAHVAAIRLFVAAAAASWDLWGGRHERLTLALTYARAK